MATLTPAQVAQVAYDAGFRGDGLVWAVAYGLVESGGKTDARGRIDPRDRGLWQINSRWHPEVSDAQADNPATAAAAVYRITRGGTDWSDWPASKAAATASLGRARMAAAQVSTAAPATGTTTAAAPAGFDLGRGISGTEQLVGGILGHVPGGTTIDGLASLARASAAAAAMALAAGEWISDPHHWVRVLEVLAGTSLLFWGVKWLADTGAGPAAALNAVTDSGAVAVKKSASLATQVLTGGTGKAAGTAAKAATAAKAVA